MTDRRIRHALLVAAIAAAAAFVVVPLGLDAKAQLAAQDNPDRIVDCTLSIAAAVFVLLTFAAAVKAAAGHITLYRVQRRRRARLMREIARHLAVAAARG
jgi:hypothetical protein